MNKQNCSFIIHGIIALAIYAIFSFVPAVEPISPMGMRLIGLLIGYYYALLIMGNPGLVSVATILLFGFSGYTQLTPAIIGAAGSIPMNIILAVMLLGGVMSISGLAKGIAEKIISSKMANALCKWSDVKFRFIPGNESGCAHVPFRRISDILSADVHGAGSSCLAADSFCD